MVMVMINIISRISLTVLVLLFQAANGDHDDDHSSPKYSNFNSFPNPIASSPNDHRHDGLVNKMCLIWCGLKSGEDWQCYHPCARKRCTSSSGVVVMVVLGVVGVVILFYNIPRIFNSSSYTFHHQYRSSFNLFALLIYVFF